MRIVLVYGIMIIVGVAACKPSNEAEVHSVKQVLGSVVDVGVQQEISMSEKTTEFPKLKYTTGIRAILEDSQGNTWFASHQEGVAKYDGEKMTYYETSDGLTHMQVRSMYEHKDGTIWFEGGFGLSYYYNGKISAYDRKSYSKKQDWGLSKDDLWFKGDPEVGYNDIEGQAGVYRYDGQSMEYHVFPIDDEYIYGNYYHVSTPFERGKSGRIWIGTYGAVIGYDGEKFDIIDTERCGLSQENGLHVRGILEDSKGRLWIANNGIGVFLYEGGEFTYFSKEMLGFIPKGQNSLQRSFSAGEDAEGNIWFGTYGSGVWRYDGSKLVNFSEKHGLPSKHIWTIYLSKGGEIWFGGADPAGVYRFNGKAFDRIF